MAPITYDWPDDAAFIELFKEHGSVGAVARSLGFPARAAQYHAATEPLYGRLREIKAAQKTKAKTAAKVGTPVDPLEVVTQERDEALRAASRHRGEEVATERVIQSLERGIREAEVSYKPAPRRKSESRFEPHTLVLLHSDDHAGEVVSLEETNGLNEYNWQIMLERWQRMAQSVRSHRDHYGTRATKLHILNLGDGLSGSIHEELKDTNEFPFSECIVRFGEDQGEWILREFGEEFEEIQVDGVVGNHPRNSKKPRSKTAYDNGDWVSLETTRIYLRQAPNITVRSHKAKQAIVDICGENWLALHGEGVRTTMAGVPWGGIIRHSDKLRQLFGLSDIEVAHVAGGHWHNRQIAEDFSIFINGSIKGIDEYSIDSFGGGKPPGQILVACHPRWGVTGAHKIDL